METVILRIKAYMLLRDVDDFRSGFRHLCRFYAHCSDDGDRALFLPAIIELKKPKDAGPRILIDNPMKITLWLTKIPIVDIEETQELVFPLAVKNAGYLSTLPNMEF